MAVQPGATNLEVVNTGTKFQTATTRPNPACNAAPVGTNGPAGCGSLQITGTGLTSITLSTTVRGNRQVAGAISSNDQWTMLVSLQDAPVAMLEVEKSADVTEVTKAGQVVTYSFKVTNTGNVPLTDVAPVEDNFSGAGTLGALSPTTVASLAPNAEATFTAEYTVAQADIDSGEIENSATATGTPPDGVDLQEVPPSQVNIPAPSAPGLALVKTADPADPGSFVAGQKVTYTFLATNTGNTTLNDVTPVEDPGTFSGTGTLSAITPAPVTLAPSEKATFTAEYTLTQADVDAGKVTNSATGQGTPPIDPPVVTPPSTFEIPVIPNPSLTVVKSSDVSEVTAAGDMITYSYLVTNTGNTTIEDAKPVEGAFSGTGTLGAITPNSATLTPGEDHTFTAEYTVTQADIDAGGVENTATATGTPPGGATLPPTPPSTVTVPAPQTPDLTLVKSADPADPSDFVAGQKISYTFVATNTGNTTLTGVAPVEGDFSGTGTLSAITPAPVTLAPAEMATFTAEYTLTQADVDTGKVSNSATGQGTPPTGPPTVTPPSTFEIPVIPNPSLEIVKSADLAEITQAGEEITFSFLVTNTGNTTIEDAKPVEGNFTGTGTLGPITPAAKTLAPGESETFTAEYTVTQADVNGDGVENTATATGTPPGGSTVPPPTPSTVEVPSTQAPALTIEKTADTQAIGYAGDVITYSFVVKNTGNVTITDAKPVETSFSGSGTLGAIAPASATLLPGETETFTAVYAITQTDIDAGGVTNLATAEGTPPGGGTVPPPPPAEVEVPSTPDPALDIVKTSDMTDEASYQAGAVVTYFFTATNIGNVTLTDVVPVEGDFSGTGTVGPITPGPVTLAPGATASFSAEYTLTQADVDAGKVTNKATANGTPPSGPPIEAPPFENEIPTPPVPDLSIEKIADVTQVSTAGDIITYSFVVTNTGNVTITDAKPVEGTFSGTGDLGTIAPASATLAPGTSETFSAEYTVTQADIDAGGVRNVATATGTPPGGAELPPVPTSEVEVPATPAPSLSVVKTSNLTEVTTAGEVITYSFLITNTGNVTVADVAPVEGAFTGTGQLGDIAPASVTLAPGANETFTAEYTVTQADIDAGGVENTATATGTPPGGADLPPTPPSTVEVPAAPDPALTIVKSADTDAVTAAGDVITYSFLITNTGNVTVTDVVPVEGAFSGTGDLGTFAPQSATLAPGMNETFTAQYTVTQADIDAGGVKNAATATGTPPGNTPLPPVPESEIEVPATPAPALEVVKSADKMDAERYQVGEVVTYSFVVTNTGNVTLSDVAPAEGDFSGSGALGPITPAPVASLAPGAQATFSAQYTLTQADIDAGSVTNTATASGVPPTGPPVDGPPSKVTVPTPAEPGLALVKSADVKQVTTAGEKVTYSFLLTNTGNVTLTDVAPVEGKFSGTGKLGTITPEAATLLPGENATFTAEYTVTQADIDAGGVENTATATATPPSGAKLPPTPESSVTVPAPAAPALTLVKSADVDQIRAVGEVVTYSFVITNTGNVTLTDVAPVEGEFSGIGKLGAITPASVESLAPGKKATFTAKYTVARMDLSGKELTNQATATGLSPAGDTVESLASTAKAASIDLPGPSLAITGSQVTMGAVALTLLLMLSGAVLMLRRRVTRS